MQLPSIVTKAPLVLRCALVFISLLVSAASLAQETNSKVYELRVYHTNEGKLEALQTRFREHTHAIFTRLGMKVIAYWTPISQPEASSTLIYIIEHDSEEDAKQKWQKFFNDPEWQAAYQASIKNGKLVKGVDVTFMQATDYSPAL